MLLLHNSGLFPFQLCKENTWHFPFFSPAFQAGLDAATGPAQPAFSSPADWRDKWIYFLIVDRFNHLSAPPLHPPFDDPNCFAHQGGIYSGIQAQLSQIRTLGAGAIWLSPVLENGMFDQGSYHGHGIQDFLRTNPFFADDPGNADQELRDLVDAAHSEGLHVIMDIVLNHAANALAYAANLGGSDAPYSNARMDVSWRGATGAAVTAPSSPAAVANAGPDELIWPWKCSRTSISAAREIRRRADMIPAAIFRR